VAKPEQREVIYEIDVDPSYFETPEFRLLVECLLSVADEELRRRGRHDGAADAEAAA
jgi:hypothetical protein